MNAWAGRLVVLGACFAAGAGVQAHHAVAGVYDLNKEIVLQGTLKKLNFRNPHSNIELTVPNADGSKTDWVLTTASIQSLTRSGITGEAMKPGEPLKVTALPARNGSSNGFIRSIATADREFILRFESGDL
jgi:hypothetical protein